MQQQKWKKLLFIWRFLHQLCVLVRTSSTIYVVDLRQLIQPLDRIAAFFASANTNRILNWGNENFSIANTA